MMSGGLLKIFGTSSLRFANEREMSRFHPTIIIARDDLNVVMTSDNEEHTTSRGN
jgi:hypothetical protein